MSAVAAPQSYHAHPFSRILFSRRRQTFFLQKSSVQQSADYRDSELGTHVLFLYDSSALGSLGSSSVSAGHRARSIGRRDRCAC
jgi:hypothetical protein